MKRRGIKRILRRGNLFQEAASLKPVPSIIHFVFVEESGPASRDSVSGIICVGFFYFKREVSLGNITENSDNSGCQGF